MNPGDKVKIYYDPSTRDKIEGVATLVRFLNIQFDELEYWMVYFDGDTFEYSHERWIHKQEAVL